MFKIFLSRAMLIVTASFLIVFPALAHQPRFVREVREVEIKNPDVSQAFYGELSGESALYKINIAEPLELYVGVLVPDLPGITKNISARVTADRGDFEEEVFYLDGENFEWKNFFEEFAGDSYWQGPDKKIKVEPGRYFVTVRNPDNLGKYVLVVGEKESFPLGEILKTVRTLPALKKDFFGKSPWSAFNNLIGLFLGGFILAVIVVVTVIVLAVKKMKKLRAKKNREG